MALALGGLAFVLAIVAAVVFASRSADDSTADAGPVRVPAAAPLPVRAAQPTRPGIAGLPDAGWVARVSAATRIPPRALEAYAGAALAKAQATPSCGLSWNTLAAMGWAESRHGTHGGSQLGDDGTARPPIYGVSLSGAGTAHVPDSDGGAIDGDPRYDRAVGPFQLIPQTWRNWHVDGNADGMEDPRNIDDAALAAANYLCRASSDMAGTGWRRGIAGYNSAPSYAREVSRVASEYAADARAVD